MDLRTEVLIKSEDEWGGRVFHQSDKEMTTDSSRGLDIFLNDHSAKNWIRDRNYDKHREEHHQSVAFIN